MTKSVHGIKRLIYAVNTRLHSIHGPQDAEVMRTGNYTEQPLKPPIQRCDANLGELVRRL